uniref:acylphosphatase n=1 Tax=Roseihalotalea indica TaxID=2867963 RepID=A0AA49JHH8_9BACT|nr:acylphosphatase [Tunicatimonas sp. TK19036]
MPCYSIHVTGVVQGVFYRASTQEKAQALGLCGWVRNEPDGSVLICAEGDANALQQLINWCHQGPSRAEVDEVRVQEREETGLTDFRVQR